MAELLLQNIHKSYDQKSLAVKDFNLHIQDKEFIILVGPSGCGKSTILRMIAGLEEVSKGELYMNGQYINDLPTKDRNIAMVFQNYALYPHMSVYDNIAFNLKLRKLSKKEIDRRVKEIAATLGLQSLLHRKPKSLSGGQRQRVALGRLLVRDAEVFLMDEPLSNLDAKLRVQMRTEIVRLHQKIQTTTVYVTHDQTEAMTMGTKLVVMNDGRIQQVGTPKEVYDQPANLFVGDFLGSPSMNFFHGQLQGEHFYIGGEALALPKKEADRLKKLGYERKEFILGIRPEDIRYEPAFLDRWRTSTIEATIAVCELAGAHTIIHSHFNGTGFTAQLYTREEFSPGDKLKLAFDMSKVHFFDAESEKRIAAKEE
ncbi:ABC transporter ATP-binding protein [Bacillus xiapuensis]|uniref:ABC transporter ATP-binding protein n=1 Tax=Bacillus xiapuensis TaxID=2014075 RepID=UPI000C242504|nr:sn-glycerol-3-phosphate ABC transporter ATP-binding protein UgpC [Bacillus xiapuensis]